MTDRTTEETMRERRRIQTIIIGAGQAGLSTGYHLAKRGLPFLILEGNARVGDSWRKRWDSLKLFTPAQFDGLDGLPYPAEHSTMITKDEMADYLESYARHFKLPVETGVRVRRLTRLGDGYLVDAGDRQYEAEQVVIAMASYQEPRVPAFASSLSPDIVQLHSSEYRNLAQLKPGPVLLVGAGNSGAEIAKEVVATHPTILSGRDVGQVPFKVDGLAARLGVLRILFRVVFHRILTLGTPIGRKVHAKTASLGTPLIRVKTRDLDALGVKRLPRMTGVENGQPRLEDGHLLKVTNVIWCTGFHPGFSWVELPIFEDDEPRQFRGVIPDQPGLYFVGLHFMYAMSSTMIHGVGRDAAFVATTIAQRLDQVRKPGSIQQSRVA
jgi:putative flavoprotein involved in K+ transport